MTTITRQLLNDHQRINHTAAIFGVYFPLSLEAFVYSITDSISSEYNGGRRNSPCETNGGLGA